MTETQIGLLALQIAASIVVLSVVGVEVLRAREEKLKYKLFAVRDRLLYLVAVGELREESTIFKVFYGAINVAIREVKDVTFMSLVAATVKARSELEKGTKDSLDQEIAAAPMNVKKLVSQFCQTMTEIMLANSVWLVVLIHLAKHSHRAVSGVDKFLGLSKVFSSKREQYDTYRFFEGFGCAHGAA